MAVRPSSKNIQMVLEILQDEIRGDINGALKKLAANYTMTWMYQDKRGLFPRVGPGLKLDDLEDAYRMKRRKYDIRHIAEGLNVVVIELVESYFDPKTNKSYRTPLVLVLECRHGKITRGRHYCDPSLSYNSLSKKTIELALR